MTSIDSNTDKYRPYDDVMNEVRQLFMNKLTDYGLSWTILRPSSLTDQIYIKAMRIRSVQEAGEQLVDDDLRDDFIGIINYSLMALIQMNRGAATLEGSTERIKIAYDQAASEVRALMVRKDHDYGEAWRQMRISSITDLILMKLLRIKSIESNDGKTIVSETIDAGYQDIVNYAVFAIILEDASSNSK